MCRVTPMRENRTSAIISRGCGFVTKLPTRYLVFCMAARHPPCETLSHPCRVRQGILEEGLRIMATLTTYKTLLLDYQPRPIRSQATYRKALRQIEKLMSRPHLGRAESEMVELLSTLIEHYETIEHPTPESTPAEMLAHLIEARGITQAQLAHETGIPRSAITNILAGRRSISKTSALKLSAYFRVPLRLFLQGS